MMALKIGAFLVAFVLLCATLSLGFQKMFGTESEWTTLLAGAILIAGAWRWHDLREKNR